MTTSNVVPEEPGQDRGEAPAARHSTPESRAHRVRTALFTIPVAVIGTVAVSVGLVSPAQAAPPGKRTDRADRAKRVEAPGADRAQVADARSQAAPRGYVVRDGDTVSGIAARFGLSTASVLALNGLSWKSLIFPGQKLVLTHPSVPAAAPAPAAATRHYVIKSGDTVSGIAAAHGLGTEAVLKANGLDWSSIIYPGHTLTLPDGSPEMQPAAATHQTRSSVAPSSPGPVLPTSSHPIISLTDEQRANARLIVRVGRSEGVSDYGLVIALAAAAQESSLRNDSGGDRDSLGLFQQRPSMGWGTAAEVMDPERAARAFFGGEHNPNPGRTRGLLDIPGWQAMTVTEAAQAVQISAYPDSYAKWEASARVWLRELG
jgi:FOG: LysM repeat